MTFSLATDKAADVRKAIALGATGLRLDAYWASLERSKNRYSWSSCAAIDAAVGLDLTIVLGFGNDLWGGRRHIPTTPLEVAAFQRYAVAVAKKYPTATLEILNEPNASGFWDNPDPLVYNRLALATVQALRAAGCRNPIIAPSVARGGSFIDWQVTALGNGLLGLIDGLSCHFYDERFSCEAAMMQLRHEADTIAGLIGHIGPIKLVVTEIGWDRNKVNPVVWPMGGAANLLAEVSPRVYKLPTEDAGEYFKGTCDGLLTHVFEARSPLAETMLCHGIDDDSRRYDVAGPEWRTYASTARQGKQGRIGQHYREAGFPGRIEFRNPRTYRVESPSPETLALMQADQQEANRKQVGGFWYTLEDPRFGIAPNVMARLNSDTATSP